MHADLDFDVFKALTLLQKNEEDTISNVIRRLLEQHDQPARSGGKRKLLGNFGKTRKQLEMPKAAPTGREVALEQADVAQVGNKVAPEWEEVARREYNVAPESAKVAPFEQEFARQKAMLERDSGDQESANEDDVDGAWFANTFFPNGTKLRATYKGQTHYARIAYRQWLGEDGVVRTSPSEAARAVTGNNVNGWRFWHALLPGEEDWQRIDHYKAPRE